MLTGAIEAPKRIEDLHVRRDLVASLLLRTLAFSDQLSGAAIETPPPLDVQAAGAVPSGPK